jgi:hypothetical protein
VSLPDRPSSVDQTSHRVRWPRFLQLGILLVAIGFSLNAFDVVAPGVEPSPQSNEMFRRSLDLETALTPGVWPAGYPVTLWGARQLGVEPQELHKGLVGLTIVLLAALASVAGFSTWVVPALGYALLLAVPFNLALFTSEAMLVPCSLVALLALYSYARRPRTLTLCVLGLLLAYAANLRYFALVWLFPIAVFHVSLALADNHLKRLGRVVLLLCIALPAILATFATNIARTGYATGMDRLDWSSRRVMPVVEHWREQTDLASSVFLMLKTWLIDWFSTSDYASHGALDSPLSQTVGIAGLFVLALLFAGLSFGLKQAHSAARPSWDEICLRLARPSIALLVHEFLVVFLLTTVLLWTIGNNDPIHSRFVFPAYPLMIFAIYAAYERTQKRTATIIIWSSCAAGFLLIQISKLTLA